MKSICFFILAMLLIPCVNAYDISDLVVEIKDFVKGYFGLTGGVVLRISEKSEDFDANGFTEISPGEEAFGGKTKSCKDSDLLDYHSKGICKTKKERYQDYCSEDKKMVMEFYCNDNDECLGMWYVCEGKCFDGACVSK